MALGPGGGARPCRLGKPLLEPRSRAGLGDVWSGVPEGVLSSSELPNRVLFPFMEDVRGLWLLLLEFSLFSLSTQNTNKLNNNNTHTHTHRCSNTDLEKESDVILIKLKDRVGDPLMNRSTNVLVPKKIIYILEIRVCVCV